MGLNEILFKILYPDTEPTAEQKELVNNLIELQSAKLVGLLQVPTIEGKLFSEIVPIQLDFIIVETVIKRFNNLGTEGMTSESVDGHSISYDKDYDEFKHYWRWIEPYIEEHLDGHGEHTVRFY